MAQQAANNAEAAMNAAKGDYSSLNERLETIEGGLGAGFDYDDNSDPMSLLN